MATTLTLWFAIVDFTSNALQLDSCPIFTRLRISDDAYVEDLKDFVFQKASKEELVGIDRSQLLSIWKVWTTWLDFIQWIFHADNIHTPHSKPNESVQFINDIGLVLKDGTPLNSTDRCTWLHPQQTVSECFATQLIDNQLDFVVTRPLSYGTPLTLHRYTPGGLMVSGSTSQSTSYVMSD